MYLTPEMEELDVEIDIAFLGVSTDGDDKDYEIIDDDAPGF